ncbi:pyridoxine 5'-phosphate synthase [candidate division WOR-1 bacterium RIFOXYA2_FULL_36_21]|uniref:Pyridoxine 5'-phosphate synthase n=1 Tax=candidate division WOR-1 bacterium RIFOXYB2_FULL_36_35 TaxID=1802578 RepID=A0A1F4S605_UNCSA|nr:MAG: pyridoxine 5'-phosphate synthase [candidate division WOR-1 bacterium RIFOXYA2_FULL_36_21]OGC15840.1 MAG: pyridoxine 5'-phosphate synthase [candidate division WOR-1 bacterium RIFOXYB2_FULL_36_35]OGC15898.1 MAG: pyridoxine 5'-phosphate synthase [candidate division WOR-1 bacterium RIFOXYA12_FULL_36_13]
MKLGINIDHIATLRQARLEKFPDPVEAAIWALKGGADGIVCHLREDRRHIQDEDVARLRKIPEARLDLEMAAIPEMIGIALKLKPDYVTLVPEKRREITTEGGLDVVKNKKKLKPVIGKLQEKGIDVSLFIDPEPEQIEESAVLGAKFVEIHTGAYANAKTVRQKAFQLLKIQKMIEKAVWIGLRVNAGHGLNYQNVGDIVKIGNIEELNIGFSVISRAVFVGIKQAVEEMKEKIK